MGYEIHLQAFEDGDSALRDFAPVRELLDPVVVARDPDSRFVSIADGSIAFGLYGWSEPGEPFDGLMVERPGGGVETFR